MFRPNTFCYVSQRTGFDDWGRETYVGRQRVPCSLVRLKVMKESTSVRADSSASRGRAKETNSESIVLLPPSHDIEIGDRLEILGFQLEVNSITPRLDIMGRHDHNEVGLLKWVSKSSA